MSQSGRRSRSGDPERAPEPECAFRAEDTRRTYDRVAGHYADHMAGELAAKPFDRDFLDRFATRVTGRGQVVDLGCGPGHVAAYLHARGVDVMGLDVSRGMIAEARRLFPGVSFAVGDMLDLPFGDQDLAGVTAFYSIIHFPDAQLARALSEMKRCLAQSGLAAIAFHVGEDQVHRTEWWGEAVRLDARFLPTQHIVDLLRDAGLIVSSTVERSPYAPDVEYQSRRAYVLAHRP